MFQMALDKNVFSMDSLFVSQLKTYQVLANKNAISIFAIHTPQHFTYFR